MQFRKDINGLRAIAVIAVVLFHFNESWAPGGFAGVDVFFVISGFLMTGIIFKGIEQQNFSIVKFYAARANRIIPALALLCLTLLIFGWFYLTPLDYKALGKHAASSVGFISNIIYWKEAGYFDAASHEKWLLHTWSLSVEWQFYILYPLALVAMRKFMSVQTMKLALILGTVIGFALCVYITAKSPNAAYFLFPARAWEMMLGGIAYLYPLKISDKKQQALGWLGISLVVGSYAFISKETPWPGYLALFPVLGSFFILQAQQNNSWITSNWAFQKIGTWSYSIYLWHWPIVVAIYYFSLDSIFVYVGILLSVFLGFISHRFIESIKWTTISSSYLSYVKIKPLYIAIFIIFAGFGVFKYQPNAYLYPLPTSVIESLERKKYDCFDKEYQHEEASILCRSLAGDSSILVLGDSHAYSVLPVIGNISRERNIELSYAGYSGCPPLLGIYPVRADQEKKNCNALNKKIFKIVSTKKYDYIILAARWTYYTKGDYSGQRQQRLSSGENNPYNENSEDVFIQSVAETFKEYANLDSIVIVVLQVPMQETKPDRIYYKSMQNGALNNGLLSLNSVSRSKHEAFQEQTNRIIVDEANKYKNIRVVDPTGSMCNAQNCPVGDSNHAYYFDADHLSTTGSYKLEGLFNNSIN